MNVPVHRVDVDDPRVSALPTDEHILIPTIEVVHGWSPRDECLGDSGEDT